MKKWIILFSLVTLMIGSNVWGSNTKKIAVLPFSVTGSDNMDYLRSGILDMLISRLTVDGKIEVIDKAMVVDLVGQVRKKGIGQSDAGVLGKKLEADYVVWGTIAKSTGATIIDGSLLDMTNGTSPVSTNIRSVAMDDIIPKVNDFARRIDQHILGEVPAAFDVFSSAALLPAVKATPEARSSNAASVVQEHQALTALRSKEGTLTAVINKTIPPAVAGPAVTGPDAAGAPVISAPVISKPTTRSKVDKPEPPAPSQPAQETWSSQKLDARLVGMTVGDVDRDGKNEIVCIDAHNVFIYQKQGEVLKLIETIKISDDIRLLAVDMADINAAGTPQIFVSGVSKGAGKSFVLTFKNGKFVRVVSDFPWIMRVVKLAGKQTLLGQSLGAAEAPFNVPIVELAWDGKTYIPKQTMKLPNGYGVYDIAMGTLDREGEPRIAALDRTDTLCIYQQNDKFIEKVKGFFISKSLLWKSTGTFGGTANTFETLREQKANGASRAYLNSVNVRMFFYETSDKSKRGMTLARNIASSGLGFSNEKIFLSGEIIDLEWSGKEFKDAGKRIKLDGYAADMQIQDLDRNGHRELIVAVVGSATSDVAGKSTIITFPIDNKKYPSEALTTE